MPPTSETGALLHSAPAISKPALVTLALGELGGAAGPVDTEDIAVKARELSPTAFAWRRYPDLINLELVRVALVDASRPKSGSTVQGRGRGGWMLTDRGVAWFQRTREPLLTALRSPVDSERATVKQPETQHRERERVRVARTEAWGKWSSGSPVTPPEGGHVFRIDQYTTANNRLTKVRALRELFEGDPSLTAFLDAMAVLVANPTDERGTSSD